MVYDTANQLAKELKQSEEYRTFKKLREQVTENDTTKSLLTEYHRLQIKAQAAAVSGSKDDETLEKLQKIGEVLQLNKEASDYLLAEFRLNRMLGDVYKILAEAIDVDLSALED